MCSVLFCTDAKYMLTVVDDIEAVVDAVVCTVTDGLSDRHTETVVPV